MRDRIIAEAREWIGTPFHWEASVKGVGCDCKGLIAGVARNVGLPEADSAFATARCYANRINPQELIHGLDALFDRTTDPLPGDILLLRVGGQPQHLAFFVEAAGTGRMIHTYGNGPKCVIETPMGAVWWRAVVGIWTWRGASGGV